MAMNSWFVNKTLTYPCTCAIFSLGESKIIIIITIKLHKNDKTITQPYTNKKLKFVLFNMGLRVQ